MTCYLKFKHLIHVFFLDISESIVDSSIQTSVATDCSKVKRSRRMVEKYSSVEDLSAHDAKDVSILPES